MCLSVMPEHGEFDNKTNQWFCSYWQNKQEWYEIHNYLPAYDTEDYELLDSEFEDKKNDT